MGNILNVPLPGTAARPRLTAFLKRRGVPLLYTGSSLLTAAAQLVAGFVVIRWVTPEEMGLWQSVRLAQIYSFLLLLGINNGLGRELPFFLGKGEQLFADRLAGTALFCVTLANSLVFVAGIACTIVFLRLGMHLACAILSVMVLTMLAFYQQIFICTFRSNDSFKNLTVIQFVEAGISLMTIPLVYYFGYNGMLTRTVLISVVVVSLLYRFRPMRVKVRLDREALKLLLKTGLPIFGLDYMKNSCTTLDRVALLKTGGFKDVGMYSLARVALQTLQVLPSSLGAYLYPRMTYKFGQNGNGRELWRFGFKFVLLGVAATGLAVGSVWFVLPRFVLIFAPKYLAGLRATQIVLLAGVLEGATLIVNALWSMKAWKLMVIYQVSSAILYALGPLLGVMFIGKSLEGVAWGAVLGSAGRSVLAVSLAYYGTHTRNASVLRGRAA